MKWFAVVKAWNQATEGPTTIIKLLYLLLTAVNPDVHSFNAHLASCTSPSYLDLNKNALETRHLCISVYNNFT